MRPGTGTSDAAALAMRVALAGRFATRIALRRTPRVKRARVARALFYESLWRTAAATVGGEVRRLESGALEIARGRARARVRENYTDLDGPVTLGFAGDKALVHARLAAHGIPVPPHEVYPAERPHRGVSFLRAAGGPCVVKPARGTGAGAGIVTGIERPAQVWSASVVAGAYGRDILIEAQIPGDSYRLLFLDGRLLDCIRRRAPSCVGDGVSTVALLVAAENAARAASGVARSQFGITRDADMRRTLRAQGLSLESVPPPGARVVLKTSVSENAVEDNEPADVCAAVENAAREAAGLVGARLAGVDVVTPDPTLELEAARGVILEVNTTPGLHYHAFGPDGAAPAAAILEALLEDTLEPTKEKGQSVA